jgi:hypothetical protein
MELRFSQKQLVLNESITVQGKSKTDLRQSINADATVPSFCNNRNNQPCVLFNLCSTPYFSACIALIVRNSDTSFSILVTLAFGVANVFVLERKDARLSRWGMMIVVNRRSGGTSFSTQRVRMYLRMRNSGSVRQDSKTLLTYIKF